MLNKTVGPKVGTVFGPRAIFGTILVEIQKINPCAEYQRTGLSGFRQEDF